MTNEHLRSDADLRTAVLGYYEAMDRDDIDAVLEFFSGDVLYRRPGYDRISGMEALRQYYASDRKIATGRHVLTSVLVDGQRVAAHGIFDGDLRDGQPTSVGFAAFFLFDQHGRAADHTTYFFVPAV